MFMTFFKSLLVCLIFLRDAVPNCCLDKAGAAESKRTSSASSEASSAMRFAILSGSQEQAAKDTEVLLSGPNAPGTTATLSDCTLCVIKPHAVTAGQAGKIISAVLDEGFEISAMQLFTLDREAAQEFLEVYKTVVPEYNVRVPFAFYAELLAVVVSKWWIN